MNDIFERSKGLLGETRFENLKGKTIAVLGLGGVGGTALESLARTGVENFVIVDFDVVDSSNLNRQVLYRFKDIGKDKVLVAKEYTLPQKWQLTAVSLPSSAIERSSSFPMLMSIFSVRSREQSQP